jgi:DHA1 family bicyclomycin/chloramphenicol resistance-like MFS transporter
MYLPALPSIGKDLNTDPTTVQVSLLAFFVTIGLGQIVVGPISDMIGRKGPMYLGWDSSFLAASAPQWHPGFIG